MHVCEGGLLPGRHSMHVSVGGRGPARTLDNTFNRRSSSSVALLFVKNTMISFLTASVNFFFDDKLLQSYDIDYYYQFSTLDLLYMMEL